MENNTNSKKGISIGSLIGIIIIMVSCFSLYVKPSMEVPKDAIAHVKQDVVLSLGLTPEKFSTDIIYKNGKDKIIVVKYGLDSGHYDGSVALYYHENYYSSSTRIMHPDYDWRGDLESVKAIFGIY